MAIQVKELYYGGGETPASLLSRQFISFKYGEKDIEEFDLVVTFQSGRLNKNGYTNFSDTVQQYNEVHGQMFFGTTYNANALSFTLSTDGIEEKTLNEFLEYFRPGKIDKLILSEHSNRFIWARVSSAPAINMIPFEKDCEIKIGENTYTTKTSEYKGDISLNFVMDYPFWQSIESCYDEAQLEDKNIIKVVYEDGIPVSSMFKGEDGEKLLLADNKYYDCKSKKIEENADGIKLLNTDNNVFLYNCGTALTNPIIEFSYEILDENFSEKNGYEYLSVPKNLEIRDENSEELFSYIQIGAQKLYYTLPGYYASYNQALEVFGHYQTNSSYMDLIRDIKDNVTDYYMRANIIDAINSIKGEKIAIDANDIQNIISVAKDGMLRKFNVKINCQNGQSEISILKEEQIDEEENAITSIAFTENCGDMIMSKYLKIEDISTNNNGEIIVSECVPVKTSENITGLKIKYNYQYL